jgi:hypothetical protein
LCAEITLGIISFLMIFAICLTESPIGVAARSPLPSIRFVMAASKAADVSPLKSLLNVLLAATGPEAAERNFEAVGAELLSTAFCAESTGAASGAACAVTTSKPITREIIL